MAWFRMMGVDSVEYHRAAVLGGVDDHPGEARRYYGSRGETPLMWGGSVAHRLGLEGRVDEDGYDAIYGPGGATDPHLGERMVRTRRPGLELVVSAKSVAVLGVMGAIDDMHAIVDAETDATMGSSTSGSTAKAVGGAGPRRALRPRACCGRARGTSRPGLVIRSRTTTR